MSTDYIKNAPAMAVFVVVHVSEHFRRVQRVSRDDNKDRVYKYDFATNTAYGRLYDDIAGGLPLVIEPAAWALMNPMQDGVLREAVKMSERVQNAQRISPLQRGEV